MRLEQEGVSFIIPVYNGEFFIEGAYENILGQQLPYFEILFVDNNSTDNSVEIILGLQQRDDRILFLKEYKQGAAAARNFGLKLAKGAYIHMFDIDDRLFDNALKAMVEVLEGNPTIQSVYGKMVKSNQEKIDLSINSETNKEVSIHRKPNLGMQWLQNKSIVPGPPCFLHRRGLFEHISGFNEELLLGEDVFFHVQVGNENDVAFLNRNIYHYFRHGTSTVSVENRKVKDKVFTYWPQILKAYWPYSMKPTISKEFKAEVQSQIFWAIGKMIVLTEGRRNRNQLKKELLYEIASIRIPFVFNFFLDLMVFWNNYHFFKLYYFYVVIPYFNNRINR